MLFTDGVHDINYSRHVFAIIMVLAQLVFCIREPYRLLAVSAGKFRETNIGAIVEAILNLGISIILVNFMGLIGVAIGTLVSTVYRYIYLLIYTRKNLVSYHTKKMVVQNTIYILEVLLFVLFVMIIDFSWITTFKLFVTAGVITTLIIAVLQLGIYNLIKEKF